MQDTRKEPAGNISPPGGLPVVESKTFLTHTMEEDVTRAKEQGGGIPQKPEGAEPFSARIPPPIPTPPMPPQAQDPFREKVQDAQPPFLERDQPVQLPGTDAPLQQNTQQEFQIRIPQKRSSINAITITLITVLLALVGMGAAGYWWFFVREAPQATQEIPQLQPTPEPEPVIEPQPVVEPLPPPEPTPVPEPIPAPEPTPEPMATTTPTIPAPEPVPEPPKPVVIPEPTVPAAIIALDTTVIVTVPKTDTAMVLAKLKEENATVTEQTATIRYLIKLSTDAEKKFLTARETAQAFGLRIPGAFWTTSSALELVGYKSGGVIRYGLVAANSDLVAAKALAVSWEPSFVDDLTPLYLEKKYVKPAQMAFSENSYLGFYKRYINMPQPDVSLDYALSDKYFIIATSKAMIYALLDETKTTK